MARSDVEQREGEKTCWSRNLFETLRVPSVTGQIGTAERGFEKPLTKALFAWRGYQSGALWDPNTSYWHVNIGWRSAHF